MVGGGGDGDAASGQDVEAEVAEAFSPLVGLLGRHGPGPTHDRGAVEEDADTVDAAANLAVESFGGLVDQISVSDERAHPHGQGSRWGSGACRFRRRTSTPCWTLGRLVSLCRCRPTWFETAKTASTVTMHVRLA